MPLSSMQTINPFWLPNDETAICTGTVGTFAAHTARQGEGGEGKRESEQG
jgi:hypothetical protein